MIPIFKFTFCSQMNSFKDIIYANYFDFYYISQYFQL